MKMSQIFSRTLRENPKDAETPSHKLLLRGGFCRQYTAGVYGILPFGRKVLLKIENIIREEMNRVEGQEITMPCLSTAELWSESGRYQAIGRDMFRLKDRNDKNMVLNMTHEEPVVYLARTEIHSYKQLPMMVYQIQNKYRDEPRPRGGLIRLREFVMKDGYSFHTSEEDLKNYYDRVHEAYIKIFKRAGLKNFVSVLSDNGMFGGRYSHEFQLIAESGEDKLLSCKSCGYRANVEIATSPYKKISQSASTGLKEVHTPAIKTIEELVAFLKITPEQTIKAVWFQNAQKQPTVVFIRGDLKVLEKKLLGIVKENLFPATDETIRTAGGVPGSTGPKDLDLSKIRVVLDTSLKTLTHGATGKNREDYHWTGFELERDFLSTLSVEQRQKVLEADVAEASPGDPCPECQGQLSEERGIEIGNIFHLGTKYSASMGLGYLDQTGKKQTPIMGCYGIGVTRLLAAIIEEHHDDRGVRFPLAVAPAVLHICALSGKDTTVLAKARELYESLTQAGHEVIWDDRDEKAGVQFADADLIGAPFRIVLSAKTLAQDSVEWARRDQSKPAEFIPLNNLKSHLAQEIQTYSGNATVS